MKIGAVVFENDTRAARRALEDAGARGADVCEIRIDAIARPDLERLLAPPRCPVIVTNRPARERGRFEGSEEERLASLRRALDLGAEQADIEIDSFDRLPPEIPRERLVASWHDHEGTPDDLEAPLARLESTGAGVLKLVTTARTFEDNLRVLALPRRATRPLIALCMGDLGRPSRLLAARFGGHLTFAAAAAGAESAPGQYPLDALLEDFALRRIAPSTEIYGILGRRIGYSLSPRVHNRAFEALGLDKAYLAFDLDDPEPLLANAERLGLVGLSVTIPYKETVARLADRLDPVAAEIGAVNTLLRAADGSWAGCNTDGPAVARCLRDAVAGEGRRGGMPPSILILGAGGVARAVAWAARSLGFRGWCASRSADRARPFTARFGLEWIPWDARHEVEAQVVCNATPLGSEGAREATPFHAERSRAAAVLFDTVYVPRRTPFLEEGERSGCAVIRGIEMFLGQAALQCAQFTGEDREAWFLDRFGDLASREGNG